MYIYITIDLLIGLTEVYRVVDKKEKNINAIKDVDFDYHGKKKHIIYEKPELSSFDALKAARIKALLPSHREHVTPYIRNNKLNCRLGNFLNDKKQENYRWTLDRNEDLILIKKIVQNINKRPILIKDIMELFSRNQNLININSHITSGNIPRITRAIDIALFL